MPAGPQDVAGRACGWNQAGDGLSATRQEDFLPTGNPFQDLREMDFGLGDVIRLHTDILTNFHGHINVKPDESSRSCPCRFGAPAAMWLL